MKLTFKNKRISGIISILPKNKVYINLLKRRNTKLKRLLIILLRIYLNFLSKHLKINLIEYLEDLLTNY